MPWPQMVQVNPAKSPHPPPQPPTCCKVFLRQRRLTHILTCSAPTLLEDSLFVCHHSGTYCHLLLQGALLSSLTNCLLLLQLHAFLFFILCSGFFFLSTSSICLLFAPASRRYFRLPPFSLQTRPPVWLSRIPKRIFAAFYCAKGRLSPSRRRSLSAVTPLPVFSSFFFWSVLASPRLSAS